MPTYEYACTSCGHHLEVVQSFSEEPLTVCPSCSGKLRKVFSPIGIVFKGSGFYKTDSRGGSASSTPAASSGSSSDGASSSSTGTASTNGTSSGTSTASSAAAGGAAS
jgi:putative FmdB family regulatory protein